MLSERADGFEGIIDAAGSESQPYPYGLLSSLPRSTWRTHLSQLSVGKSVSTHLGMNALKGQYIIALA